jgi:pimeloyl-ACP methyl ester carboxylesterase
MSPKSGRSYENFMAAASDDRIVVAPDYPGYGESAHPPSDHAISVQDYAASMWEVADALGLTKNGGKVDLLGHHTGSKVAAEAAHQRPDHVNNIVMISAAVFYPDELKQFNATYSPIPLDEEGNRFKIMWERIVEHRGPGMTLEMMAKSLAENLRGGEAYEEGHRAAFEYNAFFADVVKGLPHRITVLNPKDDLHAFTPRILEYLQNGKIIDKPGWGHGFLDAFTDDAVKSVKKALA